jgi:hypothetical protein
MISVFQYYAKPHTEAQKDRTVDLLSRVEALALEFYAETGEPPDIDPDTGTEISGTHGGDGDGGFRMPSSTTGAQNSSHREGGGVDKSDQANKLDRWLDKFEDGKGGNSMLKKHDLYREHPSTTPTWCHLTTRAPPSGKRTFYP